MPANNSPDEIQDLWTGISVNVPQISVGDLRLRVKALRGTLRHRSIIGGGAAILVIASFTLFFFIFQSFLQRTGSIFTVAGAISIFVQLRMRSARPAPGFGETPCAAFYRAELERQRDFHRGKWFWSRLAILAPGPLVWLVGFGRANPNLAPFIWVSLTIFLLLIAIAVPLNLRLARAYQRRIDALGTLAPDVRRTQ
jgi:hypothetical protein